jgi:hypothetical protein
VTGQVLAEPHGPVDGLAGEVEVPGLVNRQDPVVGLVEDGHGELGHPGGADDLDPAVLMGPQRGGLDGPGHLKQRGILPAMAITLESSEQATQAHAAAGDALDTLGSLVDQHERTLLQLSSVESVTGEGNLSAFSQQAQSEVNALRDALQTISAHHDALAAYL